MRRENINYFVVGIFVLTMLVVFFIALYKIAGKTGPADEYYVTYNNVTGVKYGTAVLYEGYPIGQVESVEPVRDQQGMSYKITLSVQKDWKIPDDSIARIVASGLLSAITINIDEGESRTTLNPGDSISGIEAESIFSAVNEIAADIHDLSEGSIKPLIDNLNVQIETAVNELTDISANNIKPLIADIKSKLDQPEMIADLKSMLNNLNKTSAQLLKLTGDNNLNNFEQTMVNLESSSGHLNELLGELNESREILDNILVNLDSLVEDNKENVELSIIDLQKSLDVISKNINAIAHHVEGSTRNIHELSRQIRENPGLILKGSAQPEKGEE